MMFLNYICQNYTENSCVYVQIDLYFFNLVFIGFYNNTGMIKRIWRCCPLYFYSLISSFSFSLPSWENSVWNLHESVLLFLVDF